MEFKQVKPATIDQFAESGPVRGLGCAGIGCLVVVAGLLVMCVGSYLALMHSSLPLAMIERTTPPSTRSAAPVVAEASGEQT